VKSRNGFSGRCNRGLGLLSIARGSNVGERSPHVDARFTWNPIYRVGRLQIPLSKDENTTRSSSNNPRKWLSS
jgi:hypothetical protein